MHGVMVMMLTVAQCLSGAVHTANAKPNSLSNLSHAFQRC